MWAVQGEHRSQAILESEAVMNPIRPACLGANPSASAGTAEPVPKAPYIRRANDAVRCAEVVGAITAVRSPASRLQLP